MANGDAALAAGMDVVPGTDDIRLSYDEINKTRDYIADRAGGTQPVSKGGTGATSAAAARVNLAITAANTPSLGVLGTGSSQVQADLEYLNGQTTVVAAIASAAQTDADAALAALPGKMGTGGGTFSGPVYLASAAPVLSGYSVLYRNVDGRIGTPPSARKYKKNIKKADLDGDLFVVPLSDYQLKGGDGSRILGYIADDLDDFPQLARFVIHGENGAVESIDHIQMLMAMVAQLAAEVKELRDAQAE